MHTLCQIPDITIEEVDIHGKMVRRCIITVWRPLSVPNEVKLSISLAELDKIRKVIGELGDV